MFTYRRKKKQARSSLISRHFRGISIKHSGQGLQPRHWKSQPAHGSKIQGGRPGRNTARKQWEGNRHEAEVISIFGDKDSEGEDENQENQENASMRGAEGQAPSEGTELVGAGSASPTRDENHEKRVDHVTPANQTAKKSGKSGIRPANASEHAY